MTVLPVLVVLASITGGVWGHGYIRGPPSLVVLASMTGGVWGHGYLWDPPSRSSMWKAGYSVPANYNHMGLNCGGKWFQWNPRNGGRCGICGDKWTDSPRPNEAGGVYARGIITRHYQEGQEISVKVNITTNRKGWFEFRACPNNDVTTAATQDCLDRYLLPLADGSGTRWELTPGNGQKTVNLKLPEGLTCDQCVVQWKWNTANSWGTDPDGTSCIGCGPQEQFYGCADVSIAPWSDGTLTPSGSSSAAGTIQSITTATEGDLTPTPTSPQAVKVCRSITQGQPGINNAWCNMNCNHNPPYCPPEFCNCEGDPIPSQEVKVCKSIAVGKPHITDAWCEMNCNHNPPYCPSEFCSCEGDPTPTPMSPVAVKEVCKSIAVGLPHITDAWCDMNCNHNPPHCPPEFCNCVGDPTPTPPQEVKVCKSIAKGQPGINNAWCETNCNHFPPYCPTDFCSCEGDPTPTPPQEFKVCKSIAVGQPHINDAWCETNCNHNPPYCPPDYCSCEGDPIPTPTSPVAVKEVCKTIAVGQPHITDAWCETNCNHFPPYCPPDYCSCERDPTPLPTLDQSTPTSIRTTPPPAVKVCKSIAHGQPGINNAWCEKNCNHNPPYCPSLYCKCEMVQVEPSTPRTTPMTSSHLFGSRSDSGDVDVGPERKPSSTSWSSTSVKPSTASSSRSLQSMTTHSTTSAPSSTRSSTSASSSKSMASPTPALSSLQSSTSESFSRSGPSLSQVLGASSSSSTTPSTSRTASSSSTATPSTTRPAPSATSATATTSTSPPPSTPSFSRSTRSLSATHREERRTPPQEGSSHCWAVGIWKGDKDMEEWCAINCKLDNCPSGSCKCEVNTNPILTSPQAVKVCKSIAVGQPHITDVWCKTNCNNNPTHCPPDYCSCEGDPTPTPTSPVAVKEVCKSIAVGQPHITDTWCETNCNHSPPHCPDTHCKCEMVQVGSSTLVATQSSQHSTTTSHTTPMAGSIRSGSELDSGEIDNGPEGKSLSTSSPSASAPPYTSSPAPSSSSATSLSSTFYLPSTASSPRSMQSTGATHLEESRTPPQEGSTHCWAVGIWKGDKEMDKWCAINCKLDNCPSGMCSCEGDPTQTPAPDPRTPTSSRTTHLSQGSTTAHDTTPNTGRFRSGSEIGTGDVDNGPEGISSSDDSWCEERLKNTDKCTTYWAIGKFTDHRGMNAYCQTSCSFGQCSEKHCACADEAGYYEMRCYPVEQYAKVPFFADYCKSACTSEICPSGCVCSRTP